MTRDYEVVYILDSALEDEAVNESIGRFHDLLSLDAETVELDHWGRRQLAYKIGTRDTAYYVIARFAADPTLLPEYERALRLDDSVIRYLISLHEHELGAPPMTEEQLAARRRDDDDDDEEE